MDVNQTYNTRHIEPIDTAKTIVTEIPLDVVIKTPIPPPTFKNKLNKRRAFKEQFIKDNAIVYITQIEKSLKRNAFKKYIYIDYYELALQLTRNIGLKYISNITFKKESQLAERTLQR